MKNVFSLEMVRDMFEVLADNEYSLLWDLVDDFMINGHNVSIKDSTKFKRVIIDGVYYPIGGTTQIQDSDGKLYKNPLDFTMSKLEKVKENNSMDFKDGSIKSIREAIGNKVQESSYIKEYPKNSPEYKRLETACALLNCYNKYTYTVENIYFDAGQDWMWSTIVCHTGSSGVLGSWQVLSPKDHEKIVTAANPEQLGKAVDDVMHDEYFKGGPQEDDPSDEDILAMATPEE